MAKKKPSSVPVVQKLLDAHGEVLAEQIVSADSAIPGSLGAKARLFDTLVVHCVPKPTQRVDVGGFQGFKIVDVE